MSGRAQIPMTVGLEPVQLVGPDGMPTAEHRYSRDLPVETLCWLYEMMVVTRELDAEFVNLKHQGELGLFASCRGQEAAQVGSNGFATQDRLAVPPIPRVGRLPGTWYPARTRRGRLARNLAWRAGIHQEMLRPDVDSNRHPDPARRRRGNGRPTPRRGLRDGGLPGRRRHQRGRRARGAELRGGIHHTVRVLRAEQPVGDFDAGGCKQTAAPSIAHKAIGYGMPGIRVDGNDVLACYAVMTEAAALARAGDGPTLIEAVTYRLGPHTTADDPSRYRNQAEVDHWLALDPRSPRVTAPTCRAGTCGRNGGAGRRPGQANAGRTARRGIRCA